MQFSRSLKASLSVLLAAGSSVLASPLDGRADSTSAESAIITSQSLSASAASSAVSTSTPTTLKTSSAAAAASASASGTVTSEDTDLATASVSSAASGASATSTALSTPSGGQPRCTKENYGPYPPFCDPPNGTDRYVGDNYYVSWDSTYFSVNSTVTLFLDYSNVTGNMGANAWQSDPTRNDMGFVIISIDQAWLQNSPRNNLTFQIVNQDASPSEHAIELKGPTISVTNAPAQHLAPGPTTQMPSKLGIEVGIPVAFGVFLLVVGGLWIGMRKHRKIDVGGVMGKNKGYGAGQSRRQRMRGNPGGIRLGKKGGIRLGEREVDGQFTDDLAGDMELQPRGGDGFSNQPTRGNAFRDEIQRQRTGR